MPNQQLKKSLRRRIYVFCCLLVLLCITSTMIGWLGQTRLLENFAAHEMAEATLSKVANLDQDVQDLKSRSEKYLQAGSPNDLLRAIETQQSISQQIADIVQENTDDYVLETLSDMQAELSVFHDRLTLASSERDLRTRLIQEDLPNKHQRVIELLEQLQNTIRLDGSPGVAMQMLSLVQTHSDSLTALQQYFIQPDSAAYDSALQSIKTSRSLAKAITNSLDGPDAKAMQTELDQELKAFKQIGSRAFQATRSYMFYSNVVMAGEISEFVYDSNRLKQYVEKQRAQNREVRSAWANRVRTLGLLASLTAVGLAGFFATQLSYMIVSPIINLTETFRRLGQGEMIDAIPGIGRNDEIGRMARAAKIFSDKNKETQKLLERSKELAAELSDKAMTLEKTNQELDNFAYVASHDLKSPLRGINSLAGWVQEDCEAILPDASRKHLQQMQQRVTRMEALLDDLLEYSRAGRLNPQPESVDVGELVASVVSMLDTPTGYQINLMSPTFAIHTVRTPLMQTLMNLVSNGIKYNDKGDRGRLKISASVEGDFVRFTVSDNGPGIESQYHEKIFEMYQRLDAGQAEGSGMGLAIVKKLVAFHGGELWLESEQGKGSTFSFTWPRSMPEMPAPEKVLAQPKLAAKKV